MVHAAPSDEAARVVRERAPERGELITWPISALRARPPYVVGAGTAYGCGTQLSDNVPELIEGTRRAIGLVQLDAASLLLERALDAAVCGPVDREWLFDLWFLQAMIAVYHDDPATARALFRNARTADPERTWDEQFADGREQFDEAEPLDSSVRLSLLPATPILRVDGRASEGNVLALAPGSHLLEIGEVAPLTVRVDLEGRGDAVLVLPALLPDTMLRWPSEPARWHDLSLVLGGLPGPPSAVGLYAAPELWWAEHSHGPYTLLPPPVPPEPRPPFPRWTAGLGAAGLLGTASAAICTVGGLSARKEALSLVDAPYGQYADALDRTHRFSACVAASDAVAVLGLGGATIGVLSWRISR